MCVLGAVVYVALRKSKEMDDADGSDAKAVQERLTDAVNRAAHAAKYVLNAGGDIPTASETALTTYAEISGVTWQPHSYGHSRSGSVPHQIRCRIGTDVVTLSINAEVVQLKAEHNSSTFLNQRAGFGSQGTPRSASVVLRIADEEQQADVLGKE